MMKIPFLKKGDKVAIIATAKNFQATDIAGSIRWLETLGFEVVTGSNLYKKHNQFAGTDQQRIDDFQEMLDDHEIKSIFFARGGYGSGRIIDQIDFTSFYKNPKWLIGFSDVTVIHCKLQREGFPSIHGPMPITFMREGGEKSLEILKDLLFGKLPSYLLNSNKYNRFGKAEAKLVGGNLTILHNNIGTQSDVDYTNKILFIEEIDEYLYHLDRMMVHFKRMGTLKHLAGIIVGQFSDMKDNPIPFGKTYQEIILDSVKDYNFPVCFGFPAGHETENMPLILGETIKLDVNEKGATIDYSLYNTSSNV